MFCNQNRLIIAIKAVCNTHVSRPALTVPQTVSLYNRSCIYLLQTQCTYIRKIGFVSLFLNNNMCTICLLFSITVKKKKKEIEKEKMAFAMLILSVLTTVQAPERIKIYFIDFDR